MCNNSSTKTRAHTPVSSLNSSNSCTVVEMHGAETLLFLMFAANMNTHTGAHTYTNAEPVTNTAGLCFPHTADKPQLFSLPPSLFAHSLFSFVALPWPLFDVNC
ncbi:hypothetical protein EXN66_Car015637 [Channa argus]|uniref:Uncharacterized protein n=1 Tax=Channa argus TaxID=215402 RepID=A0A6G1QBC1_CHAAH|nr:hypothetical protein EXN66_Car015637 [Channa argus]